IAHQCSQNYAEQAITGPARARIRRTIYARSSACEGADWRRDGDKQRKRPADPRCAPIEYLECPASAIAASDDSFDAVLCQHGLQFFPDRAAAAAEMRRVAAPGGTAVMSTWAAEHPLGLFGS